MSPTGGAPTGPVLRVGVVGLGTIAREVHLPVLRQLPQVEVTGLVDPDPAARARALRESGFGSAFASLEAWLEAGRAECALVLAPKQVHAPLVRQLLEAGLDVFCEKPLTTRLQDAEALVALAAARGRVLMVGFNRRYAPVYALAREAFAEAPPEVCVAVKNRPGTEYRATFENAIHMVDLLRWFCGEAVAVQGAAVAPDPYFETTATATLRFAGGSLGVLLATRATSHWLERLEAYGPGCSAVVEAPHRVAIGRNGAATVTEMTARHMGWAHVADTLGFRAELMHFFDCVRTRATPLTSGAEALRTQALMDRILAAMGLPVEDRPGA